MSQIPATPIRQVFLILLIAAMFGVIFWNLYFFVPAVLGAYTMYVLLRTPMQWIIKNWKWGEKTTAGLLMFLSFVMLMIPFNWIISMLSGRIFALFQNSEILLQNAEQIVRKLEIQYNVSLLTPENLKSLSDWAVSRMQGILGATVSGIGLLIVLYFILWFMMTEGKKMERSFFEWMPLRNENVAYVRKYLNDMIWGNALGIPLMGAVQGVAGLLIYWLLGVHDPWLWFAVTFVAGMMPVVGVALAYVPLALILLAEGSEVKALIIFLYGFIIVGSVDNIARMWFLKTINQTHPLVTLFGVIVGLQLFGFIGFIFGPILIASFILLLRIYQKEFHHPIS
jgi:predicted PurR-regulated permease PerM